jgi:AcrR family transcriptional regulator
MYINWLSVMGEGGKQAAYRRKSAVERRRELIEAGIACLGEGGMTGFTIERICRQAGVSRGLINHHFNSKDELLLEIYAEMTRYLLTDGVDDGPLEYLRGIIDFNFDAKTFNVSNLRAWLAVWGEIAVNPPLFELHRQRYEIYKKRIVHSLRAVAAQQGLEIAGERLARQLIAMIDGLWLEYCLHPREFTLEMARRDCYELLLARGIPI